MSAGLETDHGELYCPSCEQTFAHGERCPTDNTRLVRIASGDSLIGRELDGRYTIGAPIGHGGMGTVYRGTQHSVGREVAIKVVTPGLVANPVVIKRFLREAKLASRLAHPNAVSVLDFGQTPDGLFYLVMELVSGRTLDRVLAAEGPLPPTRVVRIGTQICDALEGAHALEIVHRDLKPQNVMVMSTGRDLIKVLDFGLAKSLSADATNATMTHAGALLGTPAYLPPEVVSGGVCDARADLYSLGCVLYVAASGHAPFSAGSIHELIAMHATEPVPPIPGYPRRLAAVIEKLLAKDPERRYPTATAAREALEHGLTQLPPPDDALASPTSTVLGWTGIPTLRGGEHAPRTTSQPRSRVATPTAGTPAHRTATPPAGVAVPPSGPRPHVPTPAPSTHGSGRGSSPVIGASTHGAGRGSSPVIGASTHGSGRGSTPEIAPPMTASLVAPESTVPRAGGSPRRSRMPLVIAAIAIVLAGAVGAFVVMKSRNASAPASTTAPGG